MKMRRMPSHPAFKLEGRSRHFQSFWELELVPGEATIPHQHYESEELIYLVAGQGEVRIAELERRVIPGEVVLVPPCTDHVIANRSESPLRAITVESRLDLAAEPQQPREPELSASAAEVRAHEGANKALRTIQEVLSGLPARVDEAAAIRTIVELFDIGGRLAEEIESQLGLDNQTGVDALSKVERQIMLAVVDITGRYNRGDAAWPLG